MTQLQETSPKITHRSGRISLRVDPETDGLLRCAADLEHKTLTAFMIDAAWSHARDVIEDQQRIALTSAELARVLDELERPAEVVMPLLHLAEQVVKEDAES